MIYALWEVTVPLLVAFAFGLFAGFVVWRWRRTPVSSDEWRSLNERADEHGTQDAPGSKEHAQQIADLSALVEIRDIEIEQLRQSIADYLPDVDVEQTNG